jgi:hypothetical protein
MSKSLQPNIRHHAERQVSKLSRVSFYGYNTTKYFRHAKGLRSAKRTSGQSSVLYMEDRDKGHFERSQWRRTPRRTDLRKCINHRVYSMHSKSRSFSQHPNPTDTNCDQLISTSPANAWPTRVDAPLRLSLTHTASGLRILVLFLVLCNPQYIPAPAPRTRFIPKSPHCAHDPSSNHGHPNFCRARNSRDTRRTHAGAP